MCRFSIEVSPLSPSRHWQYQPMGQEGSSLGTPPGDDPPRPYKRHRRSPDHRNSVSEDDASSSGSSDESDQGLSSADEASTKLRRFKSVARSRLSSQSVSSEHGASEESDIDPENAEDLELPFPSRLSSPTNSSPSVTSRTPNNASQDQIDNKAREMIDLCTPEPETPPPKLLPKSNRPSRLSRSPSFGSQIKREQSRSPSPNTPRRRRAFESWEAYKDDIAKNFKPPAPPAPPAPLYKACARCQSKRMVCDGRERCQRCIYKNSSCIYNEKGTEACLRCQKYRHKCDKEIPCNRCIGSSAKCTYEQEPPKFEEPAIPPVIKAEEATSDHVPSAGVSPPKSAVSQEPRKLKRPAKDWIDRYREKTEPTQSATRTQQRYPRPPKPLRAKKPLRNARDQRGRETAPRKLEGRHPYEDFEIQMQSTPTRFKIADSSAWTRLDRDEVLQLGNTDTPFEMKFGNFLHDTTHQSPESQQWATIPSPISFGGLLNENAPSQVSAGRSSEILRSTGEQKRPSFLKPLQNITYISLGPNIFTVYQDFLDYHSTVLASALLNKTDRSATPEILADVDVHVFGLFIQWLYTQSLLNKNSQPAYQHRSMALWVLAKRLQMPALQNDSLGILEERRRMEGTIQTKTFAYIYDNTVKGDPLRRYLADVCSRLMGTFGPQEIEERFPDEMRVDIKEALAVHSEDAGATDERFEIDTQQYYVPVDNS